MALYYSIFYILLEPVAGTIITPLLLGATAYFKHLTTVAPYPTNQIAFAIFCLSWIAQFIGHGAFEGRAPALFENLHMALVTAPFFEWIEILFKLGYRPELETRVRKMVTKETERVKEAKAAAKNSKSQ
jgi:2-hydroxy fatty acid dioxygenase